MPTPRTQWRQLEPPGFGTAGFGDLAFTDPADDRTTSIHSRGFGDEPTVWVPFEEN